MKNNTAKIPFTPYQKLVIFILAITQFTVVLDFMVMSPLGDMLIKSLNLTTSQFGFAVSAYAFSAGISGLLTAGFADKYDRKKLLLFFYFGFIAGTFCCSLATSFITLMLARIITGLFGGVIGSIAMAIVVDLFDLEHRGRVMGFVQMGLGVSQVLGIPVGLILANAWGWPAPFVAIAILSAAIALIIILKMKPVAEHLKIQRDKTAVMHLLHTIAKKNYRIAFSATALLAIGGFMMMPFGSAFAINNLKLTQQQLPILFMIAGIGTLITMPLMGKFADKVDKYKLFVAGSIWMIIMVLIYTNLSATPLPLVITLNVIMMVGIMGRFIPAGALMSAIPDMPDRGAFMSINASLQQIAGGVAAAFAGIIVVQKDKFSPLEHYNTLGYIIAVITIICILMMYRVNAMVKKKMEHTVAVVTPETEVITEIAE
jgi:predicted MFS family arabinose efflux permease